MNYRSVINAKTASATEDAVFDFANQYVAGETVSSGSVTAVVYSGTDATPSAVLSGAGVASGTKFTQKVVSGVEGVAYLLTCTTTSSSGKVRSLEGFLIIVPPGV